MEVPNIVHLDIDVLCLIMIRVIVNTLNGDLIVIKLCGEIFLRKTQLVKNNLHIGKVCTSERNTIIFDLCERETNNLLLLATPQPRVNNT